MAYEKAQANLVQLKELEKEHQTMQSLLNDLRVRNWEGAQKHSYHVDLPTVNDKQLLPLFEFIPSIKSWYEGKQELAQVKPAYEKAQANLAQLKELEQKHKTMQLFLNDLRARNWEGAEQHFNNVNLPTINDKPLLPLSEFIPTIKRWYEGTQALAQVKVAYKEAQTNLARAKNNQEKLQKEHSGMQSVLKILMDMYQKRTNDKKRNKMAKAAEEHALKLVNLPTVNYDNLTAFIKNINSFYKEAKDNEQERDFFLESSGMASLGEVKEKLNNLQSALTTTQQKPDQAHNENAELNRLNKLAKTLGAEKAETFLTQLVENNQKAEKFLEESLDDEISLKEKREKIDQAIDIYRKIIQVDYRRETSLKNANVESAQFGLTVLVPLYLTFRSKKK